MRILVTGSSGHLGEALVSTLGNAGHDVVGIDILPSATTAWVGSITDRSQVRQALRGAQAVLHTATLHKPHVATHSRQDFIDTNISGTLVLLEEAVAAGVDRFIFTSTTSAFGDALRPSPGQPAVWVTEDVVPSPKNIYGATKCAAEDLCQLFFRNQRLPCLVLRTSRFFPEADDDAGQRGAFDDLNLKVLELLYRRVDIEDVVSAHLAALEAAPRLGFGKFIISATSPFLEEDLPLLNRAEGGALEALRRRVPGWPEVFAARGWNVLPRIDRVYVNERARRVLGWQPQRSFATAVAALAAGQAPFSPLVQQIGIKSYHAGRYADGLFPVEPSPPPG